MSFSKKFLWGGASASAQYEGGALEGGRGLEHLDYCAYIKKDNNRSGDWIVDITPELYEKYKNNEKDYYFPFRQGADFYHHYKEDIKLLGEMGMKVFRMSISWGRLYPTGYENKPLEDGVKFYHEVFQECHKYGIEPLVTMTHYGVPTYLTEKLNGWDSEELIELWVKLGKFLIDEYKDEVKYWLTFNEINMIIWNSYCGGGLFVERSKKDKLSCVHQALHHQFIASALVVKYAHEHAPQCMIGNMVARVHNYSYTCKPEDEWATYRENEFNLFFNDVMVYGEYPQFILNYYKEMDIQVDFVKNYEKILKEGTVDFLSFSYYFTSVISSDEKIKKPLGFFLQDLKNPYVKLSEWGWATDPIGLRITLNDLYRRYHKPLFIAENGLGAIDKIEEDGSIHDRYRIDYMRQHFTAIEQAIEDGVDVLGITTWGMIDFVSCGTGQMSKRYGYVFVDADDFGNGSYKRIAKDSYYWYKKVIETNGEDMAD